MTATWSESKILKVCSKVCRIRLMISWGIIASINLYQTKGAENIRYGNCVPANISEKLMNQYACGKLNSEMIESTDKRYHSLVVIEKENKIWEDTDGTRGLYFHRNYKISVCYFV